MINVTIDVADLLHKIAQISDAQLRTDVADAIVTEAVLPELSKYPGQSHAKQPFVSDKSRRYFFAALKRGEIVVPYRRTGALGLSANWTRTPTAAGVDLTSTKDYSDLVRTKPKQAKFFQGTWDTDEAIAAKIEGDIAEVIGTAEVIRRLRDAGLA